MGVRLHTRDVREATSEALERAATSTWLERLARAGLVARGLLYLIIAALALQIARGDAGTRADKQGALQAVVRQPLGTVLVLLLAVGFAGYALWRLVEASVGPRGERGRRKAAAKRLFSLSRAGLYALFCASAVKLLVSSSGGGSGAGGGSEEADWTRRVLDWPGGRVVVAAAGVAVMVGGLSVGWRGMTRSFRRRLKRAEMTSTQRRWVLAIGTVGMVARMLVFLVIGGFLVVAAVRHDPGRAVGVDGALKRLADRPYGPAVLVAVACGLAAYGLYSLAEARYRRVGTR